MATTSPLPISEATKRHYNYNKNINNSILRSVVFTGATVSSTNEIDRHDITEILLRVALNTSITKQ
jgi:predicted aspartyl protease